MLVEWRRVMWLMLSHRVFYTTATFYSFAYYVLMKMYNILQMIFELYFYENMSYSNLVNSFGLQKNTEVLYSSFLYHKFILQLPTSSTSGAFVQIIMWFCFYFSMLPFRELLTYPTICFLPYIKDVGGKIVTCIITAECQ